MLIIGFVVTNKNSMLVRESHDYRYISEDNYLSIDTVFFFLGDSKSKIMRICERYVSSCL